MLKANSQKLDKMRDFKKLDIWKNGIELVKQVYQLSGKLPSEEKFGLKSQITRAVVSIPSNIAEGCSRNNSEVETQLIITKELNFIIENELTDIFSLIQKEARMINSLINKIKNS
jgi:hypothetical protein